MPRRKQPKPAEEMTTEEAVNHLFHPDMADALRDAVSEKDEEMSTDEDLS